MHQGDELHPQSANSIPSGVGSHPSQHTYLFIFCPESFLLNMKAIFEHWTVTLLGCLLVDKTWKSNLLSWAFLRIYSAERGGVERQATSSYLYQMPACFLRNEIEGGGGGGKQHTHRRPKGMTAFPFLLHCPPAPYFRGMLPAIALLSKKRSRANTGASPGLSAKLWTPSSQRTVTPALLPSHTYIHLQHVCKW